MKTQKRNKYERAFSHGFRAGLKGLTEDFCPHQELRQRGEWYAGWREGRAYYMDGYVNGQIIPEPRLYYHTLH